MSVDIGVLDSRTSFQAGTARAVFYFQLSYVAKELCCKVLSVFKGSAPVFHTSDLEKKIYEQFCAYLHFMIKMYGFQKQKRALLLEEEADTVRHNLFSQEVIRFLCLLQTWKKHSSRNSTRLYFSTKCVFSVKKYKFLEETSVFGKRLYFSRKKLGSKRFGLAQHGLGPTRPNSIGLGRLRPHGIGLGEIRPSLD